MRSTLAVLAGGLGRRMGKPKSLLTIGGRPILEHLMDRLDWPGPTLLVTGPGVERPPGYRRFAAEASDAVANEGPLRGILTALEAMSGDVVVATTVDMPNVGREQVSWLEGQLRQLEHATVVACQGQPFPCALRAEALQTVRGLLRGGRRSVRELLDLPTSRTLAAPPDWPESVWLNLNRPEDLDLIEVR